MRGPRLAQGGGQTTGAKKKHKAKHHWMPFDALREAEREAAKGAKPTRPQTGMGAALEEYQAFKAAGMLKQWRERWRHILINRNG